LKYSIQIPVFITLFFAATIFYVFLQTNNAWTAVFWAAYKNGMIIGCLYFLCSTKTVHTDRIFLRGAIMTNLIQAVMYLLCPFSTGAQKVFFFTLYGWFVVLIGAGCIGLYLKELLWKQH
jgi:hypothetical protein